MVDEACELESTAAALELGDGGAGETRISTISNRASEGTTTFQADRPISAALRPCWFLSTTWTSRLIRSRSTSLSSTNDSLAISMACYGVRKVASVRSRRQVKRVLDGTYIVALSRSDVHHS